MDMGLLRGMAERDLSLFAALRSAFAKEAILLICLIWEDSCHCCFRKLAILFSGFYSCVLGGNTTLVLSRGYCILQDGFWQCE